MATGICPRFLINLKFVAALLPLERGLGFCNIAVCVHPDETAKDLLSELLVFSLSISVEELWVEIWGHDEGELKGSWEISSSVLLQDDEAVAVREYIAMVS